MADGVVLNAGVGGATAATDDCGAAGHTQIVKLAIATDGDATPFPGDATTGLWTNPTDRAARDLGKVDIASVDQYTPVDVDSGAGTVNALPVTLMVAGAGGVAITGDATNGLDVDITRSALPTGAATEVTLAALNAKVTACNTGAVVVSSGTLTAVTSITNAVAVTNAGITTIAGAVAGTEMQVDIVAALPAGTNAIGKLAANTGVDIGDVDVTSIAAGTNTIGGVIAQPSTSLAYDGTTSCTVKRFMVVTSTDGADLITAVADKKFRVLSFGIFATSSTATNYWLEDSDGTDVFGDSTGIPLIVTGATGSAGMVLQHNPFGWFQTPAANKDLSIKLTAAQKVVVVGTYIEVA